VSLFGAVVRTVVNTAVLPVAAVKDVMTLGGNAYTAKQLEKIKDEAET
jgi:hypothetical protein